MALRDDDGYYYYEDDENDGFDGFLNPADMPKGVEGWANNSISYKEKDTLFPNLFQDEHDPDEDLTEEEEDEREFDLGMTTTLEGYRRLIHDDAPDKIR